MTLLKGGFTAEDPRLDRVPTGHTKHLDKYPLTAGTKPAQPMPMTIGVNWYSNFDSPVRIKVKGRGYNAIGQGDLGNIRGGHATCLKPHGVDDSAAWWEYYNQGQEGRCVEFAKLRMMTLLNRKRYDITSRWGYHESQERDYWQGCYLGHNGPAYAGTSVDAGMQVLKEFGAIPALRRGRGMTMEKGATLVRREEGISSYRWALTWDDVRSVLGVPDWLPGAPMLNSWGRGYPHITLLLDGAGERLLNEGGEFAVVTDR